jgi:DNA-binding NarL/FixJ family response regulator
MTLQHDGQQEVAEPIRVLVADDDDVARSLISAFVRDDPSLELVGVATDTNQAIELTAERHPDVAVLDLDMPGGGGWRAAEEIKARSPETQTIALTALDTPEAEYQSMRSGVSTFLTKGAQKDRVLEAIKGAVRFRPQDEPARKPAVESTGDGIETALRSYVEGLLQDQADRIDRLETRVAELERSFGVRRGFP